MSMHKRPGTTVLAVCLSLAAGASFAGDGPPLPVAPAAPAAATASAPPPPAHATAPAVPSPPEIDEAALQARLDAARHRLEAAAQQLAALSAQMSGPMLQRFRVLAGPPHALIGVQLGRSSDQVGARVREVSPGGPAEEAGVRAGDVIVAVNGAGVRSKDPARRVLELLRGVSPGAKVHLRVLRDGKARDLTVTARPDRIGGFVAGRFPEMPPLPSWKALAGWGGAPEIIRGPVADMELARLSPGLGRYFGTDTGVLVVRAPPDGALGLEDGDVILSIGGRKPIDSSHVIRILGSYDPGEKLTLEVLRQHRRVSIATKMPRLPPLARRVLMIRGGIAAEPGTVITLRRRDRAL